MKPWMSKGLNEGIYHVEKDFVYWIQDANFPNKGNTVRIHLGALYIVFYHFYEKENSK